MLSDRVSEEFVCQALQIDSGLVSGGFACELNSLGSMKWVRHGDYLEPLRHRAVALIF
jgi:hypothetical protein